MELQQFVTEALRQIVTGVAEAQKAVAATGGEVGPRHAPNQKEAKGFVEHYDELQPVFHVGFDVAVTITEGSQTGGRIGVVAGMFGIGAHAKADETNSVVSRLKFDVPISYPRGAERPKDSRR